MGYSELTCDLCSAPLTGVEPCEPPIELMNGGHVLWCTFVCEGPEPHRWTVMVDSSEGAADCAAVALVPETRHRRAADELTLRAVLRTVAGVQELVLLVARIEVSLVKSVARLERHAGLVDETDSRRLRELIAGLAPLLDDAKRSGDDLRTASEASDDPRPE